MKRLIIFLLLIGVVVTSGCIKQTPTANDTTANLATLHSVVIDKTTKEPIENAIVYLGTGYWKCYTDDEGKCTIKDFAWGDYGLGVFLKGYNRFTQSSHFEKGDNYLTIELEKKSEIPISFSIEGTVIEIITAEGTKSENHYYKIRDDSGNEEYIFNEIGRNEGFEEFVNKEVRITGFREKGFIGWQHEEVEGIYVENIELATGE